MFSGSAPADRDRRRSALAAALLGATAFGLYAATLYPSVSYGDSGELIAAAHDFGVNHPPSNPSWIVAAGAFARVVPAGAFAWRVNLFSAAIAASGVAFLALFAVRRAGAGLPSAVLVAAAMAVSPLVWGQAILAEVYLLSALVIAVLLAPLSVGTSRSGGLAWVLAGLGMGVHYGVIFALPSLCGATGAGEGSRGRRLAVAGAGFLSGSAVMLYVWMRAGASPMVDFGHIHGIPDFLDHVLWRKYADRVSGPRSLGSYLVQVGWTTWIFLKESWWALPSAVLGVARLLRGRRVAFLLFGPVYLFGMAFLFNHNSLALAAIETPPKLLPLLAWTGLLAVVGAGGTGRKRALVTSLFCLCGAGAAVLAGSPAPNAVSRALAVSLLEDAGTEPAVLFVEGDIEVMPLLHLKVVEGIRPNVTVVDRSGYYFENFYGEPPEEPRLWLLHRDTVERRFLASHRGRVFYSRPPRHLEGARVVPHGMLFEVLPPGSDGSREMKSVHVPEEVARWLAVPERLEHREREALARFPLQMSVTAGSDDRRGALLREAVRIGPESPVILVALARHLASAGSVGEALGLYRRASSVAGFYEPALAGEIQSLVDLGDVKGAIDAAERFRQWDPTNPYTLGNLARLYEAYGDVTKAARLEAEAQQRAGDWERMVERYAESHRAVTGSLPSARELP